MRAAAGARSSLDAVMLWPWHRTVRVWAEARDMHDDTWGLLLGVWYKNHD